MAASVQQRSLNASHLCGLNIGIVGKYANHEMERAALDRLIKPRKGLRAKAEDDEAVL